MQIIKTHKHNNGESVNTGHRYIPTNSPIHMYVLQSAEFRYPDHHRIYSFDLGCLKVLFKKYSLLVTE
jgi:hypothetical protein